MKKILFVSHFSDLYGSNRSMESIVSYFRKQNVDVEVLLPSQGPFYRELRDQNIKVTCFKYFYEALYVKKNIKYLTLPVLWLYNIIVFPFLLLKIYRIKPDLIYLNSSVALGIFLIPKILRVKFIVHIREFMDEDFGAYCIFGRWFKKRAVLSGSKIIFVSQAVAKSVVGEIPDYGKVIYNGLKIPSSNYEFESGIKIGVVGNLDVSKQQHLAISFMPEILRLFPYAKMHIIGDKECDYKYKLQNMVKDLGVDDAVIFDGFVSNVDEIYSKFNILLMCSRAEAFGRVTVEAMLRRRPVIGFNKGGTPELIENGQTGFLFDDCKDVIESLSIIVNNPTKTREIVDRAYKYAIDNFSERKYVYEVYNFVVDDKLWRITKKH